MAGNPLRIHLQQHDVGLFIYTVHICNKVLIVDVEFRRINPEVLKPPEIIPKTPANITILKYQISPPPFLVNKVIEIEK